MMEATQAPSILDLAVTIQASTRTIAGELKFRSLPLPSFSPTQSPYFPEPTAAIAQARRELLEACLDLRALICGPNEHMLSRFQSQYDVAQLRYLNHFKIPQHIPGDGSMISYAELATKAGEDEGIIKRLTRRAICDRIFCEPKSGFVAQNANSVTCPCPS